MMVLRCRFSAVRKLLRKFAYFFAGYGFGAIGSVQRWVRSEAELFGLLRQGRNAGISPPRNRR
jgi:hypothetical protein